MEVTEYLGAVRGDRGVALQAVFDAVCDGMPVGYELHVQRGLPTWVVPLDRCASTYDGQPLAYVALGIQRSYSALYLMALPLDVEVDRAFRQAWDATGRPLELAVTCVQFRWVHDVALDVISQTVATVQLDRFVALHEARARQ